MNETIQTILSRRSIRAFKAEQIKEEELQSILEAGKFAPSAINQQSWHFSVVQNKEMLNKINEIIREIILKSGNKVMADRAKQDNFSVFYNAPTLIIISGDSKAVAPQLDGAVAQENMFLAAESLGIGSCWVNALGQLFTTEEGRALRGELGISEGYNVLFSGAYGYKAMEASPAPRLENTVTIIR